MAKQQAWERFDESFDELGNSDEPLADYGEYVGTTWEGGRPVNVLVANPKNDKVETLDPDDWIGRAATQRTIFG